MSLQVVQVSSIEHRKYGLHKTDWNCPICRAGAGEKASVSLCDHQFCLGCIVRWLKRNPSCPLCSLQWGS
uniref:RING-type domain-containing protein n=1 Tax=Catharus ustulatus TaxID=91951 RepID=A0A8C3XXH8_CATUS